MWDGWPSVRLLNFYERLSAIRCSYNIHLLRLHPRATQRVYNVWVLARDSYLTATLLLGNLVQSPIAVVWRMCGSATVFILLWIRMGHQRSICTSPTSCSRPPPSPLFPHPDVFIQWCLDVWLFVSIKGYHREALYGSLPCVCCRNNPNVCVQCF